METKYTVYEIINITNGYRYIGCSAAVKKRFDHHKHCLKLNKHKNQHLQRAWNKYGENSFSFVVLFEFNNSDLMYNKEFELVKLNKNNCYNLSKGGKGGSYGSKWSIESRQKLSKTKSSTAKQIMTQEIKNKISETKKGRKMHEATKHALIKSKQLKCIVFGIKYNSIKEAAEKNNLTTSKMRRMIYNDNIKDCYFS